MGNYSAPDYSALDCITLDYNALERGALFCTVLYKKRRLKEENEKICPKEQTDKHKNEKTLYENDRRIVLCVLSEQTPSVLESTTFVYNVHGLVGPPQPEARLQDTSYRHCTVFSHEPPSPPSPPCPSACPPPC